MSDPEERDMLAAEFVLGSLQGEAAEEARRLLAADAAFARAVRAWEARLAPLAALAPPVEPPAALWRRIDASIDAQAASVVPLRRRAGVWQATTAASLAIAACLAAFIVLQPARPVRMALLAPIDGGAPVLVAVATPGGGLAVRPTGDLAVAAGRDLELWELPPGATRPRSLGVLPAAGRRLAAAPAPDARLLVSLEPKGGSPTGQPTGKVLYGGVLAAVN